MKKPRSPERDPLNLSGLPMVEPPADGWPQIEAALKSSRQAGTKRRAGAFLAVAAAITLAVGLIYQQGLIDGQPQRDPPGEPATANLVPGDPQALVEQTPEPQFASLSSLLGMSQQLERNVRLMRSEVSDMPLDSLMLQVELQDLVAQVDDALSITPDSEELWGQRVNLLVDLAQLYERQLRREQGQLASL